MNISDLQVGDKVSAYFGQQIKITIIDIEKNKVTGKRISKAGKITKDILNMPIESLLSKIQ